MLLSEFGTDILRDSHMGAPRSGIRFRNSLVIFVEVSYRENKKRIPKFIVPLLPPGGKLYRLRRNFFLRIHVSEFPSNLRLV